MLYDGNSGDFSVANGVVIAMNSIVFVSAQSSGLDRESLETRRALDSRWFSSLGLILGIMLLVFPAFAQHQPSAWQTQVRKFAETKDWDSAMRIVERELARAPQDMDVRAWRARVLNWSGHSAEAEKEYLEILKVYRNDADNWMGLASAYLREGKDEAGLLDLDRT